MASIILKPPIFQIFFKATVCFLKDGIDGLLSDNHKGGFSKLVSEQEVELKEHIVAHHYHDSKALIEYIKAS
jgi:hypothetical protein